MCVIIVEYISGSYAPVKKIRHKLKVSHIIRSLGFIFSCALYSIFNTIDLNWIHFSLAPFFALDRVLGTCKKKILPGDIRFKPP